MNWSRTSSLYFPAFCAMYSASLPFAEIYFPSARNASFTARTSAGLSVANLRVVR